MRLVQTSCALLAVVFVGTSVSDAQKLNLKLNLKKGDVKKMVTDMDVTTKVMAGGQNINMKMKMTMDMSLKVKDVDAKGVHSVEFAFDRVRMNMAGGPVNLNYDSKTDKGGNPIGQALGQMVGKPITAKITPDGKATDIKAGGALGAQLGQLKDQLAGMTALPGKPIAIGDSWTQNQKLPGAGGGLGGAGGAMKTTYTLKARKNGVATLAVSGKMTGAMSGTITGTQLMDEKTGWVKSGTMDMKMSGMQAGANMSMEGKIKITPGK